MSSVRFIQELGEGAFGKVYRGELLMNGNGPLVIPIAIKTLKENSAPKTRADFRREAELMAELQHPNIVCLLGVTFQEEPAAMLFEYMRKGDLQSFLVSHGPNSGQMLTASDSSEPEVLEIADCLHIATQIAAGMEYLASHHYIHRDLATRNCLVGEHLTVKIADFGLSRDIYSSDYYRVQSKSLLPVRYVINLSFSSSYLMLIFDAVQTDECRQNPVCTASSPPKVTVGRSVLSCGRSSHSAPSRMPVIPTLR